MSSLLTKDPPRFPQPYWLRVFLFRIAWSLKFHLFTNRFINKFHQLKVVSGQNLVSYFDTQPASC